MQQELPMKKKHPIVEAPADVTATATASAAEQPQPTCQATEEGTEC
jgi:hypothetical protein